MEEELGDFSEPAANNLRINNVDKYKLCGLSQNVKNFMYNVIFVVLSSYDARVYSCKVFCGGCRCYPRQVAEAGGFSIVGGSD
jgi:hypothetical protein